MNAPLADLPLHPVKGIGRERHGRLAGLMLASLGVVYGDLGTSPLYTLQSCFGGSDPIAPSPANILGILSLIFWSLILVVSLKYVVIVMRADNHGEGGILALVALAQRGLEGRTRKLLLAVGLCGAALFFGDGMVTPAISVLSAVEGLGLVTHALDHLVVPITLAVLLGLFLMQRFGTEHVGRLFGPVMCIWFFVLAFLGIVQISGRPDVLAALDPRYGLAFFQAHGWRAFTGLGAVVLALTGAEALYADMGHFGARAIRLAWHSVVLPALVLNYFGQGALLLAQPATVENPFFLMVPAEALPALVLLATLATVIASQAVISGAFSMAHQAIQLNYIPRMTIRHTSADAIGQIYLPRINLFLMIAVFALVLGFKSSANLAAAYGIAVTGTMGTTTLLLFFVMRNQWHWPSLAVYGIVGGFLCIDLLFFSANLLKITEGGWFPLAAGLVLFTLMWTWKQGRELLAQRMASPPGQAQAFIDGVNENVPRLPNTAIYLTGARRGIPHALLHNLRHNGALHSRVVLATILTEDVPFVPPEHRVLAQPLGKGFFRILFRYGFMEQPDLPRAIGEGKLPIDMEATSFFVARESLVPGSAVGFSRWRQSLFVSMVRNAANATDFFTIPADRVVELGVQIKL